MLPSIFAKRDFVAQNNVGGWGDATSNPSRWLGCLGCRQFFAIFGTGNGPTTHRLLETDLSLTHAKFSFSPRITPWLSTGPQVKSRPKSQSVVYPRVVLIHMPKIDQAIVDRQSPSISIKVCHCTLSIQPSSIFERKSISNFLFARYPPCQLGPPLLTSLVAAFWGSARFSLQICWDHPYRLAWLKLIKYCTSIYV